MTFYYKSTSSYHQISVLVNTQHALSKLQQSLGPFLHRPASNLAENMHVLKLYLNLLLCWHLLNGTNRIAYACGSSSISHMFWQFQTNHCTVRTLKHPQLSSAISGILPESGQGLAPIRVSIHPLITAIGRSLTARLEMPAS